MSYSFVLNNGMPVYIDDSLQTDIVAFGIFVKCGSNNDLNESGCAHFIEHILFSNIQYDDYFINSGYVLNAYTTREYTLYSLIGTKDDFLDVLFHYLKKFVNPIFSNEVFEREKSIVLKEILCNLNADSKFYDTVLNTVFDSPNLCNSICGNYDLVKKQKKEVLIDVYNTYYSYNRMCVSISGIVDRKKIEGLLNDTIGKVDNLFLEDKTQMTLKPKSNNFQIKNGVQVLFSKNWPCVNVSKKEVLILKMISLLLGDGMSSDFQKVMRDKELAYFIHSYYMSYSSYGFFSIYSIINCEDVPFVEQVISEIIEYRLKYGIKCEEMVRIKRMIELQYLNDYQSSLKIMEENGKYLLNTSEVLSLESILSIISNVKEIDVLNVMKKWLENDKSYNIMK